MQRVLVALVLSVPIPCLGQVQALSLDQAIELAIADNRTLDSASLNAEAAADQVAALRKRRLPRLDLSARATDHLTEQDYVFDEGVWGDYPGIGPIPARDISISSADGTTGALAISVVQPLSQQYQLSLSIEQGDVEVAMADEQVRLARQDIVRIVKQQYFDIVQSRNELQVTVESLTFLESLAELVGHYVEQAMALDYELSEVQARLARRQLEETSQRNRLATQKERMNSLLSRNIDTPFDVANLPEPTNFPRNEDQAIAVALQQRPDVLESKLKIQDAQLSYDIKRSEYLPAIDLRLQYARLFNYQFIPDTDSYIGLHASWEIFDWGRKNKELSSQARMIQKANIGAEKTANQVTIDVRRSFRTLNESRQAVRVATLSRKAQREKLRVLMNQYREQSALLQDVLQAETELDRANQDYTRAVLSVWKAQAELERATGEV